MSMLITEREQDVLKLLILGKTNKQIAVELDISRHTVRDHVSVLLRKLGVSTRTELASQCVQIIEMAGAMDE